MVVAVAAAPAQAAVGQMAEAALLAADVAFVITAAVC